MAKVKSVKKLMEELESKAVAKMEARKLKSLQTQNGMNRHLRNKDNKVLSAIVSEIESVTDKPVFTGFIYKTNVELVVAIASALQYMKANLLEQIGDGLLSVFNKDVRTDILNAYGRLPYLSKDVTIEVNGDMVVIDPEAKDRAKEGILGDTAELELLVNEIGIELGLLSEMTCSDEELRKAWTSALSRMRKAEILKSYESELQS